MAKEKIITVIKSHKGRDMEFEGTMEHLLSNVFGYSLECGNSWNNKIQRYPKTGKALVKALNQSADECRRYYDYYSLKV